MRQQVCQLKIIGKICSPDVSYLWNQRIFRCISIFKCAIESKFKFKFITTLFLFYLFDSLPEIPFDDHNSNWNLLLIKLNQIHSVIFMGRQVPIRVWRTANFSKGANWRRIPYSFLHNVLQYHSNIHIQILFLSFSLENNKCSF